MERKFSGKDISGLPEDNEDKKPEELEDKQLHLILWATSLNSNLLCLPAGLLKKQKYSGLPTTGATFFQGKCAMPRPCHAGLYHWWYGTGAPGGCACLACLVLAGSGCAFTDSCCGRGVHWGLICRFSMLTIILFFCIMRWLCESPLVFRKSYGVVRRNKPLID